MAENRLQYLHIHSSLQRSGGHGVTKPMNVQPGNAGGIASVEKGVAQLLRGQVAYIQRLGSAPGAAKSLDELRRDRQSAPTCRRLWGFVDGRAGDCHTLIFDMDLSGAKIDVRPAEAEELAAAQAAEESEQPNVIQRAKALRREELVDNFG